MVTVGRTASSSSTPWCLPQKKYSIILIIAPSRQIVHRTITKNLFSFRSFQTKPNLVLGPVSLWTGSERTHIQNLRTWRPMFNIMLSFSSRSFRRVHSNICSEWSMILTWFSHDSHVFSVCKSRSTCHYPRKNMAVHQMFDSFQFLGNFPNTNITPGTAWKHRLNLVELQIDTWITWQFVCLALHYIQTFMHLGALYMVVSTTPSHQASLKSTGLFLQGDFLLVLIELLQVKTMIKMINTTKRWCCTCNTWFWLLYHVSPTPKFLKQCHLMSFGEDFATKPLGRNVVAQNPNIWTYP